jgi:hypothetical protein
VVVGGGVGLGPPPPPPPISTTITPSQRLICVDLNSIMTTSTFPSTSLSHFMVSGGSDPCVVVLPMSSMCVCVLPSALLLKGQSQVIRGVPTDVMADSRFLLKTIEIAKDAQSTVEHSTFFLWSYDSGLQIPSV